MRLVLFAILLGFPLLEAVVLVRLSQVIGWGGAAWVAVPGPGRAPRPPALEFAFPAAGAWVRAASSRKKSARVLTACRWSPGTPGAERPHVQRRRRRDHPRGGD